MLPGGGCRVSTVGLTEVQIKPSRHDVWEFGKVAVEEFSGLTEEKTEADRGALHG